MNDRNTTEKRLRVGVLFGGKSREREIAFAGGRAVFDHLDRRRFDPIPIFIDGDNRFVALDWRLLYKGTIFDFHPPARFQSGGVRRYIDQTSGISAVDYAAVVRETGEKILPHDLPARIDFAFLVLHGAWGEDGSIQGLLDWYGIPYTGAGPAGSSLGMDKIGQKTWLQNAGFPTPEYAVAPAPRPGEAPDAQVAAILEQVGPRCVVKHPTQGSSIGARVVTEAAELPAALRHCAFQYEITAGDWQAKSEPERSRFLSEMTDLRYGPGSRGTLHFGAEIVRVVSPEDVRRELDARGADAVFVAEDAPARLLAERFIEGREFSVIVIETPEGRPLALPPTEILKPDALYDYRSKYLAGMAGKQTPMQAPVSLLAEIRATAERLMTALELEVFARLDGILAPDGTPYFNDPNTTSGMLPGSFLFHQAAEIGFSPTGFLTYLVEASLAKHLRRRPNDAGYNALRERLSAFRETGETAEAPRKRVGVLLGGYSAERHISVESGRNVYQKLLGDGTYAVTPIYLLQNSKLAPAVRERLGLDAGPHGFSLWQIPTRMLLKDNADDIAAQIAKEAAEGSNRPLTDLIREEAPDLWAFAGLPESDAAAHLPIEELAKHIDFAFIALHGRPGEDGALQRVLDEQGIPYNGSGPEAARLMMDKFSANETLRRAGFMVADHVLLTKKDWRAAPDDCFDYLETSIGFPMLAKPNDEGCSAAVKRLDDRAQIAAYCAALFRDGADVLAEAAAALGVRKGEEIPRKNDVLFERFVQAEADERLMEITVGFLTKTAPDGGLAYNVFEPSEAVAGGGVLSLEEKFLAGEGQNITPARFSADPAKQTAVSEQVKESIAAAAKTLGATGYARADAFVRLSPDDELKELLFIEFNALPGLTPATCIFHQAALEDLTPVGFLKRLITF